MDLTTFYATVSGIGFTLLGLWWVVADKHPERFADAATRLTVYVAVVLVALAPDVSDVVGLAPLQVEALLISLVLLLGLHAAWFFNYQDVPAAKAARRAR
jgi:hypothetical protein